MNLVLKKQLTLPLKMDVNVIGIFEFDGSKISFSKEANFFLERK
jgi:hypothetical protein